MSRMGFRLAVAGLLLLAGPAFTRAQGSGPTPPDSAAATPRRPPSKLYYGGSLGMSFFRGYNRVDVRALVGYRLSPKVSLGSRIRYEYLNDHRRVPTFASHNYGGSVFSRYQVYKHAFAQGEFEYMSFDLADGRQFVPFLLVGGGYMQPVAPKVFFTIEVQIDLLQDPRSPYQYWDPRTSMGFLIMP